MSMVCEKDYNIDNMLWHKCCMLVPYTSAEVEKAKSKALQAFDADSELYEEYGIYKDKVVAEHRKRFSKSLETGESYKIVRVDDDGEITDDTDEFDDFPTYWWSYGYGFDSPSVFQVKRDDGTFWPYHMIDTAEIYAFYNHVDFGVDDIKSYDEFVQDVDKLASELGVGYGENTVSCIYGCRDGVLDKTGQKAMAEVEAFFNKHKDGVVFFMSFDPECQYL